MKCPFSLFTQFITSMMGDRFNTYWRTFLIILTGMLKRRLWEWSEYSLSLTPSLPPSLPLTLSLSLSLSLPLPSPSLSPPPSLSLPLSLPPLSLPPSLPLSLSPPSLSSLIVFTLHFLVHIHVLLFVSNVLRTHIASVVPKFMDICRTTGELL